MCTRFLKKFLSPPTPSPATKIKCPLDISREISLGSENLKLHSRRATCTGPTVSCVIEAEEWYVDLGCKNDRRVSTSLEIWVVFSSWPPVPFGLQSEREPKSVKSISGWRLLFISCFGYYTTLTVFIGTTSHSKTWSLDFWNHFAKINLGSSLKRVKPKYQKMKVDTEIPQFKSFWNGGVYFRADHVLQPKLKFFAVCELASEGV